ncbi:hypothetical protein ACWOFR_06820 [Carnobacterium gallinarum]|uniref:hypothetical protein n=1 Tax=Carnobacterium gallinarum TaxID=2749 RepID=UPI00054EAD3A|nr:hypothetical protein [Carnobacterium gallinarum]
MENYFAEKQNRTLSFLQKKFQVGTAATHTLKVLPQMPESQIHLFLNQAFEQRKPITVQINKTKHILAINEQTGLLRYSPREQNRVILESKTDNTVHMIAFEDIRYIRLAN